MSVLTYEEVTKKMPERSLICDMRHKAGRNNQGKITVRHQGGGARRKYRIIDFKRIKNDGIPATDYGGKTYYTVESILCAFMAKYGVPIAIGKPQERLQPLGAVRRYASNETWQDVVTGYLEEAKYVILYVDFTPGVLWEINKVLKHYREKLILVPRLHNIHSGRTIWLFLLSYFVFLYPLFRLFRRSLFFKRMRRGKTYYQEWDRVMQDVMPPGTIDDSIAAVHFIDGKPVAYTAKDATLEAQLTAIVQAVVDKMKGNE